MTFPDIPSDQELIANRSLIIQKEQELFENVKNGPYRLCLNLGCGARLLQGFVNIDKYYKDSNVLNYDIFKLPYDDLSVDIIFCAHALEHLPRRHAKLAILDWKRTLKIGGKIYLGIPDAGIIMTKILDPLTNDGDRDVFLYTLFGLQTNPANDDYSRLDYPLDPGQFHNSGYSLKMIQEAFINAGLTIEEAMNYDGWGTPSAWVVAKRNQ